MSNVIVIKLHMVYFIHQDGSEVFSFVEDLNCETGGVKYKRANHGALYNVIITFSDCAVVITTCIL